MIQNSKQIWTIGETVKVGFMTLKVINAKQTPGDFKPDAYLLTNGKNYYAFVPHNGLTKLLTRVEGDFRPSAVTDIETAHIEFSKI
jgi:hypothetical protein